MSKPDTPCVPESHVADAARQDDGSRRILFAQWACVVLIAGLTIWHTGRRTAFNFRTETDYVAAFRMEAGRFLAGEALWVRFHPPGYPAVLAAVHPWTGDWLVTGLMVTSISTAALLLASLMLFRGLAGPAAGWGVLAGWAASVCFFTFAVQATSDIFGAAIYQSIWLAALRAWQARAWWRWAVLGLLVGAGLLARSDMIITAPLLLLPLIVADPWRLRLARAATVIAAAAIPMTAWLGYAWATSSPVWPTLTHANVALTYFSDTQDAITADARVPLEARFHSLGDVLRHDPVKLITMYAGDLLQLPLNIGRHVTFWPLSAMAVLGIGVLWRRAAKPFVWLFAGLTLAHLLMVNLKHFEARYYLFMVPWIGASAGVLIAAVLRRWASPPVGRGVWVACAFGLAFLAYRAANHGYWLSETRWYEVETQAAAKALREHSQPGDAVCARKPLLAYYADRLEYSIPLAASMTELETALDADQLRTPGGDVYVYFGSLERSSRPELAHLITPGQHAPWLIVVAHGDEPAPWVLYRYEPQGVREADQSVLP